MLLMLFLLFHTWITVQGRNISNNKNDNLKYVSTCEKDISYSWCIPSNYDNNIEPWKYRANTNTTLPWNYHFEFSILDVKAINDLAQTITIMMYLRMNWLEPRLEINESSKEWIQNNTSLSYTPQLLKHLWYPDLEIYGVENFRPKSILKEMAELNIFRDKNIKYHTRVDTTISCQMNFDNYPLDSHLCPFQISSYKDTEETVSCSSRYFYNETMQRSLQYYVSLTQLPIEHQKFSIRKNFVYRTCGFNIILSRGRSQIFFQVYLTSAMFVIVSWLSFIIKPEVVPGRVALLVTTFLVLVNVFNSAKSQAPVSKHLNAIDVYLVGCIGHVFLALIEYAVVLFLYTNMISCVTKHNDLSPSVGSIINCRKENMYENSKGRYCNNWIDRISLIFFPSCYIIFIFVYLAIYF